MEQGYEEDLAPYGVQDRLHHYTSFQGLFSILTTRKIWATNARFLNDSTELKHGREACQQALSLIEDPRLLPLVNIVRHGIDDGFGHSVYVASFSRDPNLEAQWLKYANHGSGFAIAFDNLCLSDLKGGPTDPVRLMPVEYDPVKQEKRAQRTVIRALEYLYDQPRMTPQDVHARIVELAVELYFLLATFKAAEWSVEREWRLVYSQKDGDPNASHVLWRWRGELRVPYVELDLTRTWHGPKPIFAAIREGPEANPEASFVVKRFLREHGIVIPWERQKPF